MPAYKESLPFEVHPSVIFKLGRDLITDDFQALAELAKNGYDADASQVSMSITTNSNYSIDDSLKIIIPSDVGDIQGMIEVADDGFGMSRDDIVNGWLTISSSKKKAMKLEGRKTPANRTPLGDKGLGRLGAQRLGRVLELITKQVDGPALRVLIDWNRFMGDDPLSCVLVDIEEYDGFPRSHGTTLRIYGLSNPPQWCDKAKLQAKFLDIVSPYSIETNFRVHLQVNNSEVDLREESRKILANSLIHYELSYNNNLLYFTGKISTRYLANLSSSEKRRSWERYIQKDGGKDYFEWLWRKKEKTLSSYNVAFDDDGDSLCNFEYSIRLAEINGLELDSEGCPYDPGSFQGVIDYIARRPTRGNYPNSGNVKEFVDALTGVRVYRNGFGVPVDGILPLAAQWTSGRSWYTLQPGNTAGYIAISAENNAQLVETTNREAFQDDQYYRNFQRILAEWLNVSGRVQEALRRDYNGYILGRELADGGFSETSSSIEVAKKASKKLDSASKVVSSQKQSLFIDETEIQGAEKSLEQGKRAIEILANRAAEAEERLDDAWELAALGIIAETVSHEAANIVERIMKEAKAVIERNRELGNDSEIRNAALNIVSRSNALIKQVSHLDSSLKYVRTRRDHFSMISFLGGTADFFRDRLSRENIFIAIDGDNFDVRMNQGRLSQTVDNLINNSEYWLLDTLRTRDIESPSIHIEMDCPYLIVWDNGKGVHRTIEHSLFDPFVSRKGEGKGRGLGLFICSQLLGSEQCSISLSDERNEYGNRYKFVVDLTNVVENYERI